MTSKTQCHDENNNYNNFLTEITNLLQFLRQNSVTLICIIICLILRQEIGMLLLLLKVTILESLEETSRKCRIWREAFGEAAKTFSAVVEKEERIERRRQRRGVGEPEY